MVSILQGRKMRFHELKGIEVTVREEAGIRFQTCLTPKALFLELDHISPKSNLHINRKWVDGHPLQKENRKSCLLHKRGGVQ